MLAPSLSSTPTQVPHVPCTRSKLEILARDHGFSKILRKERKKAMPGRGRFEFALTNVAETPAQPR